MDTHLISQYVYIGWKAGRICIKMTWSALTLRTYGKKELPICYAYYLPPEQYLSLVSCTQATNPDMAVIITADLNNYVNIGTNSILIGTES